MNTNFQKAYKELNKNQKVAVDTLDGPVMVLAGPGTGKTQVLTLRIANILQKTDTQPNSILALTFTEAAAREMRERLVGLIGTPGYFVRIHTFHGFCQSVITENPDLFPGFQDQSLLTDLDRVRLLEKLITEIEIEIMRPLNAPFYYLNAIQSSIRDLKREGISVKDFQKIVRNLDEDTKERELKKLQELSLIYKEYQAELLKENRLDFEDLINMVTQKLEDDKTLRLGYQEKLAYFLVDEYQDTNSAQNKLIFTLAKFWGDKASLFVVCDPNQSIYRFQGSSTENLQEFIHRFPKATLINLIDNYRSVQNILDSAHHLIKHNPPFPLLPSFNLKSNLPDIKNTITIINAPDDLTENQSLIQELEHKHKSGIAWKEMAILGRNNRELLDLSSQLLKEKIPVRIEGGENILDNPLINHFLSLLRAINNGVGESDDPNLFTLLHYFFWKLNPSTILKLARLASDSHQTLYSYIIKNQNKFPEISKVVDQIAHFQALEANHTFPEFFEKVFQESGLSEYILTQDNPGISLSQFQDLFHFTQTLAKKNANYHLVDFIKDLDTLVRQSIKLPSSEPILQTDAVTLTTAHKSKGLEWDTIFIYRFTDRTWGNKIDRNLLRLPAQVLEFASVDTDPNAEDRRLFYVALTRAKRNLLITYANPALPSLFLSELPEDLVNKIILEPTEKEYQKFQISSLSPVPTLKDDEKEYLRELLADFKLSVTALNTYLDCGYKFKLNNLYRLPRAKDAHLSFGTAVHGALEKFHRTLRDKKVTPPKEYLLQFFSQSLDREIFTPLERSRRKRHGELILSSYYDYYFNQFTPALATEMALGRGSSVCLLEDIQLTGNIDRVDLIDANTKEVKVVDYKTGRAQTRNEIEGKTKNATMHYKRQLVFYRLLGDLANNFPYKVKEAELDFIEPDNGKFRKEKFEITAEEVKELKHLIKETMKKIRALEFNRTTDTSLCQSCEFLSHCYPTGIK